VSKGGHGISDDTIERRYYSSLNNLKAVIEACD
jgi:predicted ABC-type ATPase